MRDIKRTAWSAEVTDLLWRDATEAAYHCDSEPMTNARTVASRWSSYERAASGLILPAFAAELRRMANATLANFADASPDHVLMTPGELLERADEISAWRGSPRQQRLA